MPSNFSVIRSPDASSGNVVPRDLGAPIIIEVIKEFE